MVDPISLQNVVIRSHEVVRIQKAQEDGTQLQIKSFARAMDEQTKKAEEDVNETPQAEKNRIRQEKEKEGEKRKQSDAERDNKQESGEEPGHGFPEDDTGQCIDVKA